MRISRRKKNFTQRKLAKRLRVSQSYISQLENNRRYKKNTNIKFVIILSKTLDICPLQLVMEFTDCCSICKINCPFELKTQK
ncbi:helix-turn-helix transcriptional regulator [Clostridium botulinum]|uniref:helix-turn-helix domain-containing protein n=1 Tax=Clostridium botulinum TaxID=1491 RepID=UPI001C9AAEDC|nr:helix-turn-helix transcriptional regulator [Clostridium botulinum]